MLERETIISPSALPGQPRQPVLEKFTKPTSKTPHWDSSNPVWSGIAADLAIRPMFTPEQKQVISEITIQARIAEEILQQGLASSNQEIQSLSEKIARFKTVQNQIIEANLRLVIFIASRYPNKELSFEDAIQYGYLGLMRAVPTWDPRDVAFSTHAFPRIRSAIRIGSIKEKDIIRIPERIAFDIQKLTKEEQELIQQNNEQTPLPEEILNKIDVSRRKQEKITQALRVSQVVSLQKKIGDNGNNHFFESIVPDKNPSPSDVIEKKELEEKIESILRSPNFLSAKETRVLQLKFGFDFHHPREHNNSQIGNRFGLTREGIRLIEQKALEKLSQLPEVQALKVYLER